MTTTQTIEPGIYRRISHRTHQPLPGLWIHYPRLGGGTVREPAHTTSVAVARKLRATRMVEVGKGIPGRDTERTTINALLDAFEQEAIRRGRDLPTLRSHLTVLRPALGALRVRDFTTTLIETCQAKWQAAGTSNARINRRCNTLRAAFNHGRKTTPPLVHVVPHIPRLDEPDHRGRRYSASDRAALRATLPAYLQPLFGVAVAVGIRRGQLTRTLRRYVDLDQGVIEWPPAECKAKRAHRLPLDGEVLAIVTALMQRPPLHCPFLFHGPDCAPGHQPSKRYGCVGDFKRAWRTALKKAGLPIGRKAGGFVFHNTRNTAATDLRAGGMDEGDVMAIGGWKTANVFRHYDLGDVHALRERLAAARAKAAQVTGLVTRRQRVAQRRAADDCTTTAQQPLASPDAVR
jgi:integrase